MGESIKRGKILIVDDSKDIVSFIKDYLEDNNYDVVVAYDGEQALNFVNTDLDVILLDIMMPKIDGLELCKKIRDYVDCPIIFLTAKETEADRIKGLGVGADDYIVKPFSVKELGARIDAHLRRQRRLAAMERKIVTFGNLSIDYKGKTVFYKSTEMKLTAKEFEIIELLSLNAGQIFSKEAIYEKLWGYEAEGDSSSVTEHVKNIRAKFAALNAEKNYITTIWGVGYKWEK